MPNKRENISKWNWIQNTDLCHAHIPHKATPKQTKTQKNPKQLIVAMESIVI